MFLQEFGSNFLGLTAIFIHNPPPSEAMNWTTEHNFKYKDSFCYMDDDVLLLFDFSFFFNK